MGSRFSRTRLTVIRSICLRCFQRTWRDGIWCEGWTRFSSSSSPAVQARRRQNERRTTDPTRSTMSGQRGNINRNYRVKDDLSLIHIEPKDSSPGNKMANQDFHHILATVLQYMKERGREGFAVRKGRILYHIKYAITGVRGYARW